MNKFILILALVTVGCASNQPTRTALNCQTEPVVSKRALFIGGSKIKDTIECQAIQVPVAPKAQPLPVDSRLIDKNQN